MELIGSWEGRQKREHHVGMQRTAHQTGVVSISYVSGTVLGTACVFYTGHW